MAVDPTHALLLIVGLGEGVTVTDVVAGPGGSLVIGVVWLTGQPCCGAGCSPAVPARRGWSICRRSSIRCGPCGRNGGDGASTAGVRSARSPTSSRGSRRPGHGSVSEISVQLGRGWRAVMRAGHQRGRPCSTPTSAGLTA